jgi:predicted tellurium resistance membrane protein TerC
MGCISSPENWTALLTLTLLEIVLGIDNIVFISILTGTLPAGRQARARILGLVLAMVTRVLVLLSLTWMMRLTETLFAI